jgi:hypothetical protein
MPLLGPGIQRSRPRPSRALGAPESRSVCCSKTTEKGNSCPMSCRTPAPTTAFSVHMFRMRGSARPVQRRLGHTWPVTPANMYADVAFEDVQAGVGGLYGERADRIQ